MPDAFFENPEQSQEIEKIKIGEKEYSQEQLQKLVGLGEIGLEAEEKYKTRIDKVWPNYQRTINEKQALEQQLREERERFSRERQPEPIKVSPAQMTPDQIRAEALKQAEELGIGPQSMRKIAMEIQQGAQLLSDINGVIADMTGEGLPSASADEVIAHMQETGIRNPEKAYKDMFEKEWLTNQTAKLAQIKPSGMATISTSTAGGKTPTPVRVTAANLDQLMNEAFSGKA